MARWPVPLFAVIVLVQTALGAVLFAVFQEYVPVELGAGNAWGGYLLGAFGLARFVAEGPTGAISDRIERKRGLLAGFALMAPAVAVMTAAQHEAAFLFLAAVLGLGSAFLWPAIYAIAADLYPSEDRGKIVGFLNVGQLLGFGIGALTGAALIERAPDLVLAIAAAAVVAAAAAAAATIPAYRDGLPQPARVSIRRILSKDLIVVGAVILGSSMCIGIAVPLIRPFAAEVLDVSFARVTVALIPAVIVGGALYVPAGWVADRAGRGLPVVAGLALMAAGLLATSQAQELWLAAICASFVFCGSVITVPAVNAAVMDLAPVSHRGALIGVNVALTGLGIGAGPTIGGAILEMGSAADGLVVAAGLASLVAVLALSRRSAFDRRTAAVEPV